MLMRRAPRRAPGLLSATGVVFAVAFLGGGLTGCGSNSVAGKSGSGSTEPPPAANISGNWQITLTPTAGDSLFPSLSGYIQQNVTDGTATNYVSEEFSAAATSGCYTGINAIPGSGQVEGTQVSLDSFSVNGQYLDIYGTINSAGTSLTGTYTVSGGCAGGAQGTASGTQYAALTGTYTGSLPGVSGGAVSLTLQQNSLGNGNGQFEVGGTASFTGWSCFTTGTLAGPSGWVSGSTVQLDFGTGDPSGAQVVFAGTMDAAASTVTLSSVEVTAGACAGQYGTGTLAKQ